MPDYLAYYLVAFTIYTESNLLIIIPLSYTILTRLFLVFDFTIVFTTEILTSIQVYTIFTENTTL